MTLFHQRILGFDVGGARIGVARSTALGRAEPVTVLRAKRRAWKDLAEEIRRLAETYESTLFVVGLPRNMDGTTGPQARLSEEFAVRLRKSFPTIPVDLQDERLSTEAAYDTLAEAGFSGKQARKRIDAVAACMIVEWRIERMQAEGGDAE